MCSPGVTSGGPSGNFATVTLGATVSAWCEPHAPTTRRAHRLRSTARAYHLPGNPDDPATRVIAWVYRRGLVRSALTRGKQAMETKSLERVVIRFAGDSGDG